MEHASQPKNRKQRRAAAHNGSAEEATSSSTSTPNIKLAHPDRSAPKNNKTLVQLARTLERNLADDITAPKIYEIGSEDDDVNDNGGNEAMKRATVTKIKRRSSKDTPNSDDDDEDDNDGEPSAASPASKEAPMLPPILESTFYALCLSMLHFTLDVLVYSQYRQSIEWAPIISRTAKATPLLIAVVYFFHAEQGISDMRFGVVRQALFLAAAVGAGCYMVHSVHNHGYFAVMKRVPPVGTVWVWSVVEMRLGWAVMSLVGVGGYTWWFGYSFY